MAPVSTRALAGTTLCQALGHRLPNLFGPRRISPGYLSKGSCRGTVKSLLLFLVPISPDSERVEPLVHNPLEQPRYALLLLFRSFLELTLQFFGQAPAIDLGFRHALQCSANTRERQDKSITSTPENLRKPRSKVASGTALARAKAAK